MCRASEPPLNKFLSGYSGIFAERKQTLINARGHLARTKWIPGFQINRLLCRLRPAGKIRPRIEVSIGADPNDDVSGLTPIRITRDRLRERLHPAVQLTPRRADSSFLVDIVPELPSHRAAIWSPKFASGAFRLSAAVRAYGHSCTFDDVAARTTRAHSRTQSRPPTVLDRLLY